MAAEPEVGGVVAEGVVGLGELPAEPVVFDPGRAAVPLLGGVGVGRAWSEQVGQVSGWCGAVGEDAEGGGTAQVDVELVATPEQLAELTAVGEPFPDHRGVEVVEPADDVGEPAGGLVVLALEVVDAAAPFRPREAAGLLLELSGQPLETACQDLAALVELVTGVQSCCWRGMSIASIRASRSRH